MIMADEGVTVRPIRAIVQGIRPFILDHIARLKPLREPRTVQIFDLPCLSRTLRGAFPEATHSLTARPAPAVDWKHFAGIRSRQQCRSSSQDPQKENATRGRFS